MTRDDARRRRIRSTRASFVLLVGLASVVFGPLASYADTEIRKIMVEIRYSDDQFVEGVRVKCRGHSELSQLSSHEGLTELPLPPGVTPGDEITVELEPGTEIANKWTFLQPFGGSINVPGPRQRYYKIVLIEREQLEATLKSTLRPAKAARETDIDRFKGRVTQLGKGR
jgi:hypothetical protein